MSSQSPGSVLYSSDGNEIAAVNESAETYRVLVTPLLQSLARQHTAARAADQLRAAAGAGR